MFETAFGITRAKGRFFRAARDRRRLCRSRNRARLLSLGVTDSKKIGSVNRIRAIRPEIDSTPGVAANVVLIGPRKIQCALRKIRKSE